MNGADRIDHVLVVGGGTAGWLTAAILATKGQQGNGPSKVSLIEAPDIATVGVGEGTWPSMRTTLRYIGIKESDFLTSCQASLKQGSKFVGWKDGSAGDFYYHPYDLPQGFYDANLAQYWVDTAPKQSFSKLVCAQEHLCERHLSPKLANSAEYSGVANYGYHLDAGLFANFIREHATKVLGVQLISDKVTQVISDEQGDIAAVDTVESGKISADFFVDCSGFRSLLLGQHYGVELIDQSHVLPINSAMAVRVQNQPGAPIQSATISTAQEAGWIWDIGLATRRGVGHVYSDAHTSEADAAKALQNYIGISNSEFEALEPRKIPIKAGYRTKFWQNNCVAIGLSAGFLEPLEASSIMLTEASAHMIADLWPVNRAAMNSIANRFNRRFNHRWERVIDFLKLHYALTQRTEPFWQDAANPNTWSDQLTADMELWKHQAPWKAEFDSLDDVFPAASYQYVLYGMGFKTQQSAKVPPKMDAFARHAMNGVAQQVGFLQGKVLGNLELMARV